VVVVLPDLGGRNSKLFCNCWPYDQHYSHMGVVVLNNWAGHPANVGHMEASLGITVSVIQNLTSFSATALVFMVLQQSQTERGYPSHARYSGWGRGAQ